MTDISKQLGEIMAAATFRVETGQYVQAADASSGSEAIKIPCSTGAKILLFQADDKVLGSDGLSTYARTTKDVNKTVSDGDILANWVVGVYGNCLGKIGDKDNQGVLMHVGKQEIPGWGVYQKVIPEGTTCNNQEGFGFNVRAIKEGVYNWTAYYWNE